MHIQSAGTALEERDRLLAILSIAAHEMKTPMSALLLQAQNLRHVASKNGGVLPAKIQEKALDLIERQIGRLDQIVNTLLDVSRITSGTLELAREEVDLAQIVEDVAGRFRAQAELSGCEIVLS